MGVSRSTYYDWKPKLCRYGLDGLRVRERRRPRMPNQIGPHLEFRIIAFSLGHPGFGARRISAELRRPKWGGIRVSEHGVWLVLRRFNLNTRAKRLALIARHADPYERKPDRQPKELHIEASEPGEKVQMDCFYVGRLSGAKGVIWQYTAIDVASAYTWAFLRSSERNPSARYTAELVHLVARELAAAGWRLGEITTDNGSEFRSEDFGRAVEAARATQRRIKAGRPNSNGCAERVQLTILEECWRPAFSRSLAPKITALRRDLDQYLGYYNGDRAHTGRLTGGRVPADIVFGARKMGTVR
jgi:transposase InsO family protein